MRSALDLDTYEPGHNNGCTVITEHNGPDIHPHDTMIHPNHAVHLMTLIPPKDFTVVLAIVQQDANISLEINEISKPNTASVMHFHQSDEYFQGSRGIEPS